MFFRRVVVPMITVYDLYRKKDYWRAMELCRYIDAPDWRMACYQWVCRRKDAAAAKHADSEGGGTVMSALVEAQLYRDAGAVKRYHVKRTHRMQTVAEHTFAC